MRLIASDMDGTFTLGELEERRDAVGRWQAAGNLFCIVSGRGLDGLPEALEKIQVTCDYYLAVNGAVLADSTGKILREQRCPGEWIREILDFLYAQGTLFCHIVQEDIKRVFSPTVEPHLPHISLEEGYAQPFFYQISAVHKSDEDAARIAAELKKVFGDRINPLQNGICIDIVPAGMDKAQGIRTLLEYLKLPEEAVIAVGDNYNDLAMLDAFYSYAIESGVEGVKAHADRVTPNVIELIKAEM